MDKLRHVRIEGFELVTRATNRCDRRGQTYIAYEFKSPEGLTIFEGSDFAGWPSHADDSDETLRCLLGFLTLRPGDTDKEYFDEYTPEQLAFCSEHAEYLSLWADEESAMAFENCDDYEPPEKEQPYHSDDDRCMQGMGLAIEREDYE